jgi:curli biogenesis system outer membrane secretion channel CsgG
MKTLRFIALLALAALAACADPITAPATAAAADSQAALSTGQGQLGGGTR